MKRFFTPPMAVAMFALFIALGGSALAVRSAAKPVTLCGNGSVKAIASLNLDQFGGPYPRQFTAAPQAFESRWQCNGRSPEWRDAGADAFQIRFPGINIRSAVATGYTSRTRGSVNITVTGDIVNVYPATAAGPNAAGVFGFSIAVY
jgi:hypothetical protein